VGGDWTVGVGSLVPRQRVVTSEPLTERQRAPVALDRVVTTRVVEAVLGEQLRPHCVRRRPRRERAQSAQIFVHHDRPVSATVQYLDV